jgi:hypothetical protein
MRAGRKSGVLRVLAAAVTLSMLAGCQIPGASFGTDPLQTRFAEMTRRSVEAEEQSPQCAPEPSQPAPAKALLVMRQD